MGLKKLFAQSILWRGFYFFSILLVNIFLSRYLRAANTGNLYFINFIFSLVQLLLGLSAESAIIYFAAGNVIQRNNFIGLISLWSVVAGVITVAFTYVYFLITHSFSQEMLWVYCFSGFLYVSGQLFVSYSASLYYSKEDFFTSNFLPSLVNIAFVIFLVFKKGVPNIYQVQTTMVLFFATFFVAGLVVYFSYIIQNRREGSFGLPSKQQLKPFFKYTFTALAANVVFFLVYRIDYLFVRYSPVCTAADLGNYIQVSKLGQSMFIVPQIIASVVFPRTASGDDSMRISNIIMVIARMFSQLFLIGFIVTVFFGDRIFTIVFGESFDKMQLPMLILIPGIFSLSVLTLLSAYFSGKGKIKVNLQGAIIGLIIMITGDFIFVPRYGIIAAAAVSTLSYAANFAYAMFQFYKDRSISWIEFLGWRKNDYSWLVTLVKRNTNR